MSEQLTLGTIKHRLFEHVLAAWEQPSPPASWEALVAEASLRPQLCYSSPRCG